MQFSICVFLVLGITTVAASDCSRCHQPNRPWYYNRMEQLWRFISNHTYGDSSYSSLEEISQNTPNENDFLSKLLSNPNLRANADSCQNDSNTPVCNPHSLYRTYDGSCNNLNQPTWGRVRDCLVRILPASYEGRNGMRTSVNGEPLPGPRELSLDIFMNLDKPTRNITLFFTIFGQVVAHDQAHSTPPIGPGISLVLGFDCCPASNPGSPDCASITYPPDDPFFSKFNLTCVGFLRGLKCSACNDTGKEMIANNVTAALDLHLVYGPSQSKADQLRKNDGTGRLATRHTRSGELLPKNTDPKLQFCPVGQTTSCFRAGDKRVNQHTFLSSMHTILAREHNRLTTDLKRINPHWNDEKLYQTARRILIAKFQVMVYKEYLPVLLGPKYMAKFDLQLKKGGGGTKYNPTLRFGTWTEYTTGTFRLHSMIPMKTGFEFKRFRDFFSNPHPILNGTLNQMIQGSYSVPSQQFDRYDVPDVTVLALKQPNVNHGLDLVSIDIQRERDHGVPPYVDVLNYCSPGNSIITDFDELCHVMSAQNIQLLRQNYNSLQDVDLYVGMQMEDIMEGSVLSRTAACLGAGQFYFTKYGDRFFFEHVNEAPSFTAAQRESLKKSTIGRLICDNTNLKKLQRNPLLFCSCDNPIVPCHSRPEVDLSLWKS